MNELKDSDFARMKKFEDAFPDLYTELKKNRGRPRKASTKERLTVRLDADIVQWLKAAGRGYQTRINAILREAMEER